MKDIKRTCPSRPEVKRDEDGNPTEITGYGAVFYSSDDSGAEFEIFSDFKERIHRKAFDKVLKGKPDVRSMFNHDPNFLLGRTKAGTLRLSVDNRGLKYSVDVPQTQAGRDVAESIERGDVDGSSFWFRMDKTDYNITHEDDTEIMEIRNIAELREVGPVVFPAYEATTAQMRDEDGSAQAVSEYRKQRDLDQAQADRDYMETVILSLDQDV